jgi:hypothetical protein
MAGGADLAARFRLLVQSLATRKAARRLVERRITMPAITVRIGSRTVLSTRATGGRFPGSTSQFSPLISMRGRPRTKTTNCFPRPATRQKGGATNSSAELISRRGSRRMLVVRWQKAIDPEAWQNVVLEAGAAVRSLPLPPVVAAPPWPLDHERLSGLRVRWPRVTRPAVDGRMLLPVRHAVGRHVRLELAHIPQPVSSVVLIEVVDGNRAHRVAIDLHDLSSFRDEELVRSCLVYFKMQHRIGGYGIPQVVPGGYLTDKGTIYWYLPYLRRLRDRKAFSCDVYGRFGLRFNAELRRRAVETLSAQQRFAFRGGLRTVPRPSFLKEMARSRVCIDLPGQGAFCYRTISYLAVGACIVGTRPKNELPAPLIDRVHMAFTRDDQSDLMDLCEYYIENDDARERMVTATRRFFDRYLHADSLAAYYLHTCLARLAEA